ncbi:hypothetical protein ElyMa_001370000 [Elysia marginata]|uniref:Uncharacterized protein n=1 Tax=Elysia marginata TaxID=1093978 RepID=A0AAV4IUH5_9GAST|nr:hypothetical protein ElyMa_001370000 [Elysia marginata]
MASNVADVLLKFTVLLLLLVPKSGANDDNKEWLWKLLTSLDQPTDPDVSSYSGDSDSDSGPNLQDLLSTTSQLHLDPRMLADLKQQLSAAFPSDRDIPSATKRGFSGLLCCNHPPTKPPSTKRGDFGMYRALLVVQF